ncbi:tramtrack, beta isoform-like [Asbolus verrucosus]|uniref:Tramtrack, beta isoform-like n=1 Tax=Asbolus verrucosus TaxID=1661398 RepID=A0A482W6T4_ASBVE|nr:tramtrack, beta isoform-like [Asbolus verrucosus]
MSNGGSNKGSTSHSESSNSSPNQALMLRDNNDFTDLTLFGSPAPVLSRTGTVRRASSVPKKDKEALNGDDLDSIPHTKSPRSSPELHPDRYRKSLDSTYRLSLESISEYKTKSSFSTASFYPSRECSSMDSSSSDCTDYAVRSTTETNKDDKTLMSPGSSYLSWIESVNSEYFGSATTTADVADVDNKVGEWNNFWLNYNSARSRYLSSPYLSTSNEDRTGDELSDAKSTCSTQREFTEKMASEQIVLSVDEINEAIKCSQRITEILQNALKRTEQEFDDSKNDSYYSQPYSQQNSAKEEIIVARERSYSYAMDPQEIQKQKQLLKPAPQSSSSSCINALLNTGVADILKRVITKRREVFNPEEFPPAPRGSFSSTNKMATTEQFSLRWNNFHSNLTAGFHELLESSEMVDVTLAVEGHFFQAHKVVLSICSPYFKQMFKVNPCKHPIVILKDVAHDNMKDILEFMYMGEVNVLRENLATFLRTAELLQVKGLTGDDSSETSSRKDDKSDSIADNDEDQDLSQFSQLIDSDVELPAHYSTPRVPTPPAAPQNLPPLNSKRQAKTLLPSMNFKRTKSEASAKSVKTETSESMNNTTEDAEYLEPPLKTERASTDLEETKDNLKQILENNFTGAGGTDTNLSDQGRPSETKYNNRHTYQCEKCYKKFSRRDHLRTHEKNIHGEDAGPFVCVICSQLYKNTENEKYLVDQKVYVYCPYCCRKFVNRYNLKVHIRDKHEDNPIDLDCRICGKVMRNRSCLRVHMYHHRKQQLEATCAVPIV